MDSLFIKYGTTSILLSVTGLLLASIENLSKNAPEISTHPALMWLSAICFIIGVINFFYWGVDTLLSSVFYCCSIQAILSGLICYNDYLPDFYYASYIYFFYHLVIIIVLLVLYLIRHDIDVIIIELLYVFTHWFK